LAAAQGPGRDISLLSLTVDNARLMVIDAKGVRAGLDTNSGAQVNDIPRSFVAVDALDDDATGESAKDFSVTVHIEQPAAGVYRVIVVGQATGMSELRVSAWATDGAAQQEIRVSLPLTAKSRAEFRLHFAPAPGSRPSLEKVN